MTISGHKGGTPQLESDLSVILKTLTGFWLRPRTIYLSRSLFSKTHLALLNLIEMSHPGVHVRENYEERESDLEACETISKERYFNIIFWCAIQLTRDSSEHWSRFQDPQKAPSMLEGLEKIIRAILTEWGYEIEGISEAYEWENHFYWKRLMNPSDYDSPPG